MTEFTLQQALSALSNRVMQEEQLMFLKKSLESASKLEVQVAALEAAKSRLMKEVTECEAKAYDAGQRASAKIDEISADVASRIARELERVAIATSKAEAEAASRLARLGCAGDDAQKRLDAINAEVNAASAEVKAAKDEMLRIADRAQSEERRLTAARAAITKMMSGEA